MKKLLHYNVWGGLDMDEADRLLVAYDLFKTWGRVNKVWYHGYLKMFFSDPLTLSIMIPFFRIQKVSWVQVPPEEYFYPPT